jgi:hypothetical protein
LHPVGLYLPLYIVHIGRWVSKRRKIKRNTTMYICRCERQSLFNVEEDAYNEAGNSRSRGMMTKSPIANIYTYKNPFNYILVGQ